MNVKSILMVSWRKNGLINKDGNGLRKLNIFIALV